MVDKQDKSDKQELFKLSQSVGSGEDEHGEYDMIPLSMLRGGELIPRKVHKYPMKHIVNDSNPTPRGWYKDKHEPARRRPRPCYTEALLTVPFGGYCHVGCKFCYVDNGTRGYRSTGIPTVSPDYPDKMRNNISKMMVSGAAYISSFTEPFQKLEGSYHITQRLTQVMLDEGLPFFYLSRLLPPDWALEALLHDNYSYMQFSINSSNTDIYKKMSPGSYTIDEVMDSIANLTAMGVYTSVQCNPVLPGIVSLDDIVNLVRLGSEAGLRHIIFKFAEQVFSNRRILMDRLKSLKGVDKFDSYFSQKIGGVYTVEESLRVEWLDVLLEETRKLKMTMSTCYEYFDDGAAGSNLAPYYTTSDQCHGRGVPVFYRPEPGQPFQPFPCYRKGCLYCEDYGTKACNNDVLLQAKALSYKDLKDARIYEPAAGWDWNVKDSCAMPEEAALETIACNPKFKTDAEMWKWE